MTRSAPAVAAGALVLAAALLAVPATPAAAGQGSGDPRLTVSEATLPADRVSTIAVAGTDYLVPPHAPGADAFGGVYLFFGWVADPDRFGPSIRNSGNNDGTFGVTYAYPGGGGDDGSRDDGSGTMRLISFTAGGASGAATDHHMDDQGNWSTNLRIFGSTFTSVDTDGQHHTFDCQEVQCGVLTIGAHGKSSATNEKFTPITFNGGAEPGEAAGPASAATGRPDADPAGGDISPGGDGGDGSGPLDVTATSARSVGGSPAPILVAAGLVAALAGTLWWWRRRRSRAGSLNGPIESISPSGGTDT